MVDQVRPPAIGGPRGVSHSVWIIASIGIIIFASLSAAVIPSIIGSFTSSSVRETRQGAQRQARELQIFTAPIYPDAEEIILQPGEMVAIIAGPDESWNTCAAERGVGTNRYRPIGTPGLADHTDASGRATTDLRPSRRKYVRAEEQVELMFYIIQGSCK